MSLKPDALDNIALIKAECAKQGLTLPQQVAYVLATTQHETNGTYWPVVESYWLPDPDAYNKKNHPEYYPYYGRGYTQLTWEKNYRHYGELLGIDLAGNPDLALEPSVATFIIVNGFKHGTFTGKKITDFINGVKTDFINARRCINGTDEAQKIRGYAVLWWKQLTEKTAA